MNKKPQDQKPLTKVFNINVSQIFEPSGHLKEAFETQFPCLSLFFEVEQEHRQMTADEEAECFTKKAIQLLKRNEARKAQAKRAGGGVYPCSTRVTNITRNIQALIKYACISLKH